jgi:hypothetical protein
MAGDVSSQSELKVSSVQPAQGPVSGGTEVTIAGTGFVEGATVQFGGNEANDVSVVSDFKIEATTPEVDESGEVAVKVALSSGTSATLPEGFQYGSGGDTLNRYEIGWCKLQHPPSATTVVGSKAGPIYGRVYVEGCTKGDQHCEPVRAQVGWGQKGVDPSTSPGDFQWSDASYNPEHTSNDNDEFKTTVTPNETGTYAYTYRFSVDEGRTWTYCDIDSTDNGFQTGKMGELTVESKDEAKPTVDWCNIQAPKNVTVQKGETSPKLYSRVYSKGCTESSDQCGALTAEFGWGSTGTDPSASPSDFTWKEASYNDSHASGDNNDEYQTTVSPTETGQFAYLFRYSDDGGETWTYCDTDGNDGSTNGFQASKTGTMTVEEEPEPTVDWCNVQAPEQFTVEKGKKTPKLYSRVYSKNCTESSDQCKALTAEFGWGPTGTNPSKKPSDFNWKDATYNANHASGDNNDEYRARTTPTQTGEFAYLFRYSDDGGNSWTYCDTDGNDGKNNGFETAKTGTMTVEKKQSQRTVSIDWCKLQFPKSISAQAGKQQTVYGRVYSQGCTEDKSSSRVECKPITGELGWGPTDVDPSKQPSVYTWKQASYNAKFPPQNKTNNNDEHQASFTPSQTGTFDYVFRFSGDGGQSWTYCDTDGAPFSAGKEGSLEVK